MSEIVVVFDFDKTIVDCDSDNWVIDELGFTDLFNELLPTMPWNTLMDKMMMEMHSQGVTIEDIEEVLHRIPIHQRVIPAIKAAHALGCELRIVSDANMFFIEAILKHLGLKEYFSEINTNPGYVNEEGRVRILPYHDFNKSPHGCSNLCPPNMCKGLIIDRIQESLSMEDNKKRIIYLGDGIGDYCPSLRLKERDFMMPRRNFPVWDLICKDPLLIKAEIHPWIDGEELEQVLLQLINKIISLDESSQLISTDCKMQTLSASNHEALPKVLHVMGQKQLSLKKCQSMFPISAPKQYNGTKLCLGNLAPKKWYGTKNFCLSNLMLEHKVPNAKVVSSMQLNHFGAFK